MVRILSSPVLHDAENTCTKAVSWPSGPMTRRKIAQRQSKLPMKQSLSESRRQSLPGGYGKANTVASVSGNCPGSGLDAAVTLEKHYLVPSWND
jgi:hypothetical protein